MSNKKDQIQNGQNQYEPCNAPSEIDRALYLEGMPLVYLFNAKKGVFYVKGRKDSPEWKELTIKPVAFSVFKCAPGEELFGKTDWVEFFFFNQKGAICSLMLHGYSVKRLRQFFSQVLFYEETSVTDSILKIGTEKFTNEHGQYYIAEFSLVGPSSLEEWKELLPERIYNLETAEHLLSGAHTENVALPDGGEELKELGF